MIWFFGKKKDKKVKSNDNKKLTGDSVRIRVYSLINGSPIEKYVFMASMFRDNDQNSVILNEDMNFKEEMPGVQDALVDDILYKLESRGLSADKQIEKVNKAIDKQDKIIKAEKEGKLYKEGEEVDSENKGIRVNINTEKQRLRLLKCVKYTLENKRGEGFYESIENDGIRCLNYLIRDGELIPYWFKTPNSEGEPVTLVPDVVQRKKYYKERTDELLSDYHSSQDTMWRGILGVITKGLYIVLAGLLIFGVIYNYKKSGELYDDSLKKEVDMLRLENEKVLQKCNGQVANQVENNEVLIDVAKKYLNTDWAKSLPQSTNDNKDIKI